MRDARASVESNPNRQATPKRSGEFAAEMRAKGYKRKTIWVVDTSRPGFAEEARRQCLAVRDDPEEKEILDWIDKLMDDSGWV